MITPGTRKVRQGGFGRTLVKSPKALLLLDQFAAQSAAHTSIAQLIERLTLTQEVEGLTPSRGAIFMGDRPLGTARAETTGCG